MVAKGPNGTAAAANAAAAPTPEDGQARMGFFNTNKSFKVPSPSAGGAQMETEKE